MKLLPSDEFEIETTLSPSEIVSAMKSRVAPRGAFRLSVANALFQGPVSQQGFTVTRTMYYRNSFCPIVTGWFLPGESGVTVAITMSLRTLATVFICFWYGGLSLVWFAMLISVVIGESPVSLFLLVPPGMVAFMFLLVSVFFWSEAKEQKKMLIEMFDEFERSEQSP